jgi:hypothetical protein
MARPNRIRSLAGWRALRALIQNPDGTGQAFCVIPALSGNSSGRLCRRFRRGLRAGWLPAQHSEERLDQPLDVVRDELNLGDVPS